MSPYLLLNFLLIKSWKKHTKIAKRILQTQWVIHFILDKRQYYFNTFQSDISVYAVPLPTETPGTHQHIANLSPVLTFIGNVYRRKSCGRNFRSHCQRGYLEHEHLWLRPRHVNTSQKNHRLHSPYWPLNQKLIPSHHPSENKNNPQKENLTSKL